MVSVINFGKLSAIVSLHIFFSSISLPFPGFPLQLGYTFCNCPTDLRYFVPSFSLTCFLGISSSSFIHFSAMSSLLMSPSKAFFISVTLLSISSTFFYSSLEFPYLCLFYSSVISYSSFSIRSKSILIIVILNSWSYNYKIFAISESGFNVWFISSIMLFACEQVIVLLLKTIHGISGKRNLGRWAFTMKFIFVWLEDRLCYCLL